MPVIFLSRLDIVLCCRSDKNKYIRMAFISFKVMFIILDWHRVGVKQHYFWMLLVFLHFLAGNQSYNEIREVYYPASLRKPIQGLNYLLSCLIKPSTYFLMPVCWRLCTHFSNEARLKEKSCVIDIIFHNCDFFLILTTFSCNCNFILQNGNYFLATDSKSHNCNFISSLY